MDKIKLNVIRITTLPLGTHYDSQDGLCLRVSATCKSWNFYKYNPNTGRPLRRSLGKFPNVSVEEARKSARAMQLELDKGTRFAVGVTLADLVDRYERHLKAKKMRHPSQPRYVFNLNWTGIANRKLSDITPALLKDLHDKTAVERGIAAAAVAIKNLRALFSYANKLELYERNPAKKVDIAPTTKRDVFLNVAELKVLREVLASFPQDVQDFFELLLLTGARKGNVASMRWEDLHGDVWVIPASDFKTKKAHEVPLHPFAQAILQRRKSNDSPYVFPTASVKGYLTNSSGWLESVRRACKARGLTKHFTLHDIRRSFATLLTAKGIPLTVVAKALGHANISTTPIYARADLETVREAVMRLT